jgi:serine/threonine-protein kinase
MQRLADGERFGNYQLTGFIGIGGMGAVYRAIHPDIGRVVAIKVLRNELARDKDAVARFFDEARAVNAIRHEGIVDIFDLGRREDGTAYYVMEYLGGEDLAHVLKRERRIAPSRAVELIRQVCDALGAAHRRGIIHRDLKPQNLFVIPRGFEVRVKVLDFGVAKLLNETANHPETSTGVVLGTVHYMSPEQAQGEAIDARTDIYSIGCILYQLVTGAVPHGGHNVLAVLSQLATKSVIPPSLRAPDLGLPASFDEVVLRALAKNRDDRFSDTEELAAALAAIDLSGVDERRAGRPPEPVLPEGDTVPRRAPSEPAAQSTVDPKTPMPAPTPTPVPSLISVREPSKPTPAPSLRPSALMSSVADSAGLLREQPRRLLDSESERRIVRVVVPVELALFGLGLLVYWLPPGDNAMDHAVLGRWLIPFGATTAAMATLTMLFARTHDQPLGRWWVNRLLSLLAVALITTATWLTGALTSYDILYFPLLVIIDRLREGPALARLSLFCSLIAFTTVAVLTHFDLLPYAPLYPGRFVPSIVHDVGLLGLVVTVVMGTTCLSYLLVDHLAARVLRREKELRELGRGLAGRVQEQIELLRRSDDLRRFVEPALADAILRGDAASALGHQRRRVTIVRVDCPAIAQAAEDIDPEEFAHVLNQLYARMADLAVSHGGTVDRFAAGEISVLFGTLRSEGPGADAQAAVRFALAVLPSVAELERRCEVAGIEEPPRARAAVHTGFATVGSFGSPSRLEFTAVGPLVEAAGALLQQAEAGTILTTQATLVLLEGIVEVQPVGERQLPGARHAVRLYRVEARQRGTAHTSAS